MRKTSVREPRIHTRMPAAKKARIFASMRKIWARMPQVSDSTKIVEEDRGR